MNGIFPFLTFTSSSRNENRGREKMYYLVDITMEMDELEAELESEKKAKKRAKGRTLPMTYT
uniref:Uncharacterized protein n=1 Tax=Arundo donax TaxID=35708 RepID=A0A0A9C9S5_ARUDO